MKAITNTIRAHLAKLNKKQKWKNMKKNRLSSPFTSDSRNCLYQFCLLTGNVSVFYGSPGETGVSLIK